MRKYEKRSMLSSDNSSKKESEKKKRLFCPLYKNKIEELVMMYKFHESEKIKHEKKMEEIEKLIEKEKELNI